jgi:hypothetical protein
MSVVIHLVLQICHSDGILFAELRAPSESIIEGQSIYTTRVWNTPDNTYLYAYRCLPEYMVYALRQFTTTNAAAGFVPVDLYVLPLSSKDHLTQSTE